MANRIPGPGRLASLIQEFEEVVDQEKAERDAVRMLKGSFDTNDFAEQVHLLERMGPFRETTKKIPGVAEALLDGAEIDDEHLVRIGAMISSMTGDERRHPERFVVTSWGAIGGRGNDKKQGSIVYDAACDMSRLRRVAQGSGRTLHELVSLLNRFALMRHLMLQIGRSTGLFE